MPGFNGTGPSGLGPGTGWGQGPCGAGRRRGFSRFGRGPRGFQPLVGEWGRPRWGWRAYDPRFLGPGAAPVSGAAGDEIQALREEVASLQSKLEAIQRRLAERESS
jgi:hypothetical protein